MAGTAWTTPSGGFWPLGKITVATAGTPIALNTNVGTQAEGSLKMARRVRALIFSGPLTTTLGKNIYLVYKGNATPGTKSTTNQIVAIIPCGTAATLMPQPVAMPPNSFLENSRTVIDNFLIDADENGASVQVTAIYE